MSGIFDSSRDPPRRSIFDDDDSGDDIHETDPFLSRSKIASNTSVIDSHPSPSTSSSQNIARLPSPTTLQGDHFSSGRPPSYETPIRTSVHQSRSSYDSPSNDPWSATPRTNGTVPAAVPNFPRRTSSIQAGWRRELHIYWTQITLIFKRVMKRKALWDLNMSIIHLPVPDVEHKLYDDILISLGPLPYEFVDDRLFDALIKRYPFRQVPLMPPKRLAGMCLNVCSYNSEWTLSFYGD